MTHAYICSCVCIVMHRCVDTYMYIYITLVTEIKGNNVVVMENDGNAVVQIKRSGPLNSVLLIQVSTADRTAIGKIHMCDIN